MKKGELEKYKKVVAEFEERISLEIRGQEELEMMKKKSFKREEFIKKYITKMLYKQKEIWGEKFKEVRKELVEIKVCFSNRKTLKRWLYQNYK